MGEDYISTYDKDYISLLEEEDLPREELPRPPKYLSTYKSVIAHHLRRMNKLYSPGHRLKAFEEVVT